MGCDARRLPCALWVRGAQELWCSIGGCRAPSACAQRRGSLACHAAGTWGTPTSQWCGFVLCGFGTGSGIPVQGWGLSQRTLSFISFCTSSGSVLSVPGPSMFGPTQMARLLESILLLAAFWLMRCSTDSKCLSKTRFGLGSLSATLSEHKHKVMLIGGAGATTSWFEQVSVKLRQTTLPPERGRRAPLPLLSRGTIQKSPAAAACG